jgi:uncharacterized heparinase superfamily protein
MPVGGSRTPAPLLAAAGLSAALRWMQDDWFATKFRRAGLMLSPIRGLAAKPRDLRPPDVAKGERILAGEFTLAGQTLRTGVGRDPWDRPSPSRPFAQALHGFAWMGDLLAAGAPGVEEALRLTLAWQGVFGAWNDFAWSGETIERRVTALACAAPDLLALASDAEAATILASLGRQAVHLMAMTDPPARAAERTAAAATAAASLASRKADRLLDRALRRLERLLPVAVLPDGGHRSRSPQAALDLLFDLLTLDDALSQRGRGPPTELARAVDRLTGAVRFFALADGRLAALQGGGDIAAPVIAAALAHDDAGRPVPEVARHSGYHRLEGGGLQVFVDAGAPAAGPWSLAACAAPGALEVLVGARRLITACAWSPDTGDEDPAFRLSAAASTVCLDEASPGAPADGFAAEVLGPRLIHAARRVSANRAEAEEALVLGITHDGWLRTLGLSAERILYLDRARGELRGEDAFKPTLSPLGDRRRQVPYAIRFHLHPDIAAQVSADGKSALMRLPGEGGWWLRSDAAQTLVEPSLRFQDAAVRAAQQIVLTGAFPLTTGARIRWKLERD